MGSRQFQVAGTAVGRLIPLAEIRFISQYTFNDARGINVEHTSFFFSARRGAGPLASGSSCV